MWYSIPFPFSILLRLPLLRRRRRRRHRCHSPRLVRTAATRGRRQLPSRLKSHLAAAASTPTLRTATDAATPSPIERSPSVGRAPTAQAAVSGCAAAPARCFPPLQNLQVRGLRGCFVDDRRLLRQRRRLVLLRREARWARPSEY